MIKQEQADKYLEKFQPKELKEADLASFSAPYQKLGAYITGLMEYEEIGAFEQEFASYNFPDKLWESKEGKALALLLFGKEIAPYAQRVWDSLLAIPTKDGGVVALSARKILPTIPRCNSLRCLHCITITAQGWVCCL